MRGPDDVPLRRDARVQQRVPCESLGVGLLGPQPDPRPDREGVEHLLGQRLWRRGGTVEILEVLAQLAIECREARVLLLERLCLGALLGRQDAHEARLDPPVAAPARLVAVAVGVAAVGRRRRLDRRLLAPAARRDGRRGPQLVDVGLGRAAAA